MVLMNAGKNARNTASISNKITTYGTMSGSARGIGRGTGNNGTYRHVQTKGARGLPELYNKTPQFQLAYLKKNKLLSVNPLGSGGVGKKSLLFAGSRSGYVA
jgi:hypothetical protein|tara:strand:- start:2959 stop:3264 length:306 start_codon:yes stop_codon:yes gene_type:complete